MPSIPQIPGAGRRNAIPKGASKLPGFGMLGTLFGNAVSSAAGFAFGVAAAPVLAPEVEDLRQAAWGAHAIRVPDVGVLAAGVASGQIDESVAKPWAKSHGYDGEVFDALVGIAKAGPPIAAAVDAVRRGKAIPGGMHAVYERHDIEEQWWPALDALIPEILDPAQLAAAIHRGLVPDPGLLKGEQPSGPFKVEAYPVYPVDAVREAEGSGYDRDRLGVLVGLQGLPMGTHEAAQALFRGIITHGDYIRAFNESNSRNEWAAAVLDQSRQIPTARDFLENALRGYRSIPEAIAGAALHGMSPEHATMIYQNQGRPMALRQITQALSRGGKFKPEPGELTDPYEAAIVEGSLKPAYYDMAKALRYTLPSAFAIRGLAQSGVWSEAKTASRLKDSGWLPEDADEVAKAWAKGSGGGSVDPHIGKAQVQLWGTLHRSFIAGETDNDTAAENLGFAGVTQDAIPDVIALWDREKALVRKQLTPAQIKKAYSKAVTNEATGSEWTLDDALAALIERGYSHNDASTFLAE